ncbi:hypothetical protein [Halorussus marinus]|uniref:hypothetical protein n=1 Tax=Halorussus marinus TaxID=2505976 RepID=UPI00106E536C|nr:hypothetical protein [Halorussus marinus]
MALVEINLSKPALVEEIPEPATETARDRAGSSDGSGSAPADRSEDGGSSGGKLKLVGLLAAVAAVGVAVVKLKGRGTDADRSAEYDHGSEPEIGGDESGGRMRKLAGVVGLVAAVASTLLIARKRRN